MSSGRENQHHNAPPSARNVPAKQPREADTHGYASGPDQPAEANEGPEGAQQERLKQKEKALDRAIGMALRRRRVVLGMTQSQLGDAIGLTFQQIQKYERGANRLSVSRLTSIARVLKSEPTEVLKEATAQVMSEGETASLGASRGTLIIASYYERLDPDTQSSVRSLLATLARSA